MSMVSLSYFSRESREQCEALLLRCFPQKEARGLVQATHWHFAIDILSIYLTACQVPLRFVSCSPFDLTFVGHISLISRKTSCFQLNCCFTKSDGKRLFGCNSSVWKGCKTTEIRDYITIYPVLVNRDVDAHSRQYHGKCLVTYICFLFFLCVSVFQLKRNPSFLTWAPVLRHIVLEKCLST